MLCLPNLPSADRVREAELAEKCRNRSIVYLFDLNVTREWKFGERFKLRPTIEFGNILNTVVFNYGSEFINFPSAGPHSDGSEITAYANFNGFPCADADL